MLKTNKEVLSEIDINNYIMAYEADTVPRLERLKSYYVAKNKKIQSRKAPDTNNPDNKTPVGYGRKIIKTYTGYAYRPGYITLKTANMSDITETEQAKKQAENQNTEYMQQLKTTLRKNKAHIKTYQAGRDSGIYGMSYELHYIDADIDTGNLKAEPRFFIVDPKEIILLYDFKSEPEKKIGIRYYNVDDNMQIVEVYYSDNIIIYERTRGTIDSGEWQLIKINEKPNFYGQVPIVAYYFDDERLGLIEPVIPLIDDYDILISDSMNEFDRFSAAYLILKRLSLTSPDLKKEAGTFSSALSLLKRRRVFENVPADGDIKFLTKDIPTGFIQFMTNLIREQIHIQSHVPDFTSDKMAGASGIAIQRLLFDFENIASSAEAEFDIGLYERIELINIIYGKTGRPIIDIGDIIINHKRNLPLNLDEFATTATKMRQAEFSKYLVAEMMPDEIIPDVEKELQRQRDEMKDTVDVDNVNMLADEDNDTDRLE